MTGSAPTTQTPARATRTYAGLLLAYGAFVIYGSLVPLEFRAIPLEEAWQRFLDVPYLDLGVGHRADLVANLLLFIPLAFFAMGAATRAGRGGRAWALLVVPAATATALAIEFTQLYFPQRTVSLNDIAAETAGAVIGTVLWIVAGRRLTRWAAGLWRTHAPRKLAVKLLAAYAVGLLLYQLFPFDLTISLERIHEQWKQGKLAFVPLADPAAVGVYELGADLLLALPIGMLAVLLARRRRHPLLAAFGGGLAFGAGVELAQVFVWSRYSSATDVLVAAAGATLGGMVSLLVGPAARWPVAETRVWRTCRRCVLGAAAMAWTAAMAWFMWRPFGFRWPEPSLAAHVRRMIRVPFYHQYFLPEFTALGNTVREVVSMLVLGALLRAWLSRPTGGRPVAAGATAVATAVVLEAAQLFEPTRTPDTTSILLLTAGGLAGVWLWPRFRRVFVERREAYNGAEAVSGRQTEQAGGSERCTGERNV